MLPTLEEFVADFKKRPWNSYVKFPGFSDLYVRKGQVYINGEWCYNTLTIANVQASKPGTGAFSNLVKQIRSWGMGIHVENATAPKFDLKLKHLGFERCNVPRDPRHAALCIHFYLPEPENK
jgi:hypothetical protein